ncbi:hypothetical protein CPB85DRAFT_1443014 [Mucidula mucida]|nr:hypothetical protein CPB85DRAFT_1443014 [Mucidula mucida]
MFRSVPRPYSPLGLRRARTICFHLLGSRILDPAPTTSKTCVALRISAVNFLGVSIPSLMHLPQMAAIKSYEGRVGRRYPEFSVFEYHFGEHDPCFTPQPFNLCTPHLTCLQFPQSVNVGFSEFIWFLPRPDDFTLIDSNISSVCLGVIHQDLCNVLSDQFLKIKKHVSAVLNSSAEGTNSNKCIKGDTKSWDYRAHIQYLLGQMSAPSTYEKAAMT